MLVAAPPTLALWAPPWAASNARALLRALCDELSTRGERPLVFFAFSGAIKVCGLCVLCVGAVCWGGGAVGAVWRVEHKLLQQLGSSSVQLHAQLHTFIHFTQSVYYQLLLALAAGGGDAAAFAPVRRCIVGQAFDSPADFTSETVSSQIGSR